jgi:hypothetical protein
MTKVEARENSVSALSNRRISGRSQTESICREPLWAAKLARKPGPQNGQPIGPPIGLPRSDTLAGMERHVDHRGWIQYKASSIGVSSRRPKSPSLDRPGESWWRVNSFCNSTKGSSCATSESLLICRYVSGNLTGLPVVVLMVIPFD